MHGRTFHALCASAFALIGLGGLLLSAVAPSHHDAHGLLMAVLLTVGFAVAAMLQPSPRSLCGTCRGPKGKGFGFCVTCGTPEATAAPGRS